GQKKVADVVAIPDADQTPEQIAGLMEGVPAESQFARRLAESGCRVIVPTLISRKMEKRNGRANLTNREYLYRSAFELGRHLIGYELQKVLAGVDWFTKDAGKEKPKIGVIGYGEGGMLALYAGALDTHIGSVCVSGYFHSHHDIWEEPIDRNVFGLLEQFGDAELAAMISPRGLIFELARRPEVRLPSEGGAPARLYTPNYRLEVNPELNRAQELSGKDGWLHTAGSRSDGPFGSKQALVKLLQPLVAKDTSVSEGTAPQHLRKDFDPEERQKRQIREIDRHSQQ